MKVCLVDPKGTYLGLNPGLAYIASYIKNNNPEVEEVKVFDLNNNMLNVQERMKQISTYDVIGFSVKSSTAFDVIEMVKQFKNKDNLLVAGGPHVNVDGINFLNSSLLDVGVLGEGEITMSELLKNGAKGTKGLMFKNDGEIISNEPRGRIENLDKLPFPDYTVFDSFNGEIYNYPILTSRGCPFNCIFCSIRKTMGRVWIGRTPKSVIEELFWAKDRYKISHFNVQDDNFALDKERAKKICQMMVDEKINLKWGCYSGIRADRIDEELASLMADAGCDGVAVGIESGDEEVFSKINKNESLQQIEEAVKLLHKYGIAVEGNFIIGLPSSSVKSMRKDIEFAKKLKIDSAIFGLLIPFPGMEVSDWVNNNGKWLIDWREGISQGAKVNVLFETQDFTKEDRIKMYYESNIKCNNYFAFMDEHVSFTKNFASILKYIVKYDFIGLPRHFSWIIKNRRKIYAKITRKF